nr:integrin alpha-4-like [Maniola hyperantus]
MAEQYERDMNTNNTTTIDINHFYGGVGWTTLSDAANKLMLIAKPMPISTLNLVDMDQPLAAVKEVDAVHEITAASYKYIGGALTYGTFFKGYPKLYAFSTDRDTRYCFIAFLSYNDREKKMELLKFGNRRPKVVLIRDNQVGSMFGSALHGANLSSGNYTDLLVGAPAHVNIEGGYESGAVHIYKGGVPLVKESPRFKGLCIYSNKDASRFGSSIATTDLDEDGYPEIFISAPYEDGGKGSVYVISGYEVNQLFSKMKTLDIKTVPISDLVYTQIIQNPGLQALGFSLQALPVPIFDEFGEYFLAIGSPKSSKVALYRSIPIIKVDVKARLKDIDRVREQDKSFILSVSVNITYPPNLKVITGKIIITTRIEGDAVAIDKENYEIMLSEKPTHNVTDVIVFLGNYKKGLYKFNATVEPDTENLKRKDFDSSLVDISPFGNTTVELSIPRECQGDDCVPNLSLTFQWLGSNETHYTLGSTLSETMSVVVRNDGGATFGSCARIKVTGAQVALLECNAEEGWYKCDLTDIERYKTRSIPIRLDMSRPTNKELSLVIEVMLYNKCTSKPNMENYTKTIAYGFNTEGIYFNSTNFNRIITDVEIEDVAAGPYIHINELYTVTNKGNMTWSSLPLEIHLQDEPFNKDFLIQTDVGDCTKDDVQLKYNCILDLEPDTTVKVQGTVTLVKDKIMKSLIKEKLKVISHFKLHMEPTLKTLDKMYSTEILYQKTTSLKNNIYLVIAIAVCLGVFVMAIVIIALNKGGFFKRKEKQKLVELKHEIRKQSIRRPTIDALPQCVIGPGPEQQDQDSGSTGTSSSEKV